MTVLKNARQLLDATAAGCVHIEVQEHLNLAAMNLPEQFYAQANTLLAASPSSAKGVTVRSARERGEYTFQLCWLLHNLLITMAQEIMEGLVGNRAKR